MGKRGRICKFYLQPEDEYLFTQGMTEAGFSERGPYIMFLVKQRYEITKWRADRAKWIKKEMLASGLTVFDIEKAQND